MVTPVPASNAQIPLNHPMLSPSFWMPESPLDLSLPCHGTPVSVDKLEVRFVQVLKIIAKCTIFCISVLVAVENTCKSILCERNVQIEITTFI